jgi:hypothetical protein
VEDGSSGPEVGILAEGGCADGRRDREVPMRLRHRVVLGLAMAALAVAAPANRWLLVYAGVALGLLALVPRGPLLVQPVVQGQPAVHGDVLAGDIPRPGVAEQEQGDPGDVGGNAGQAGGDPRPKPGRIQPGEIAFTLIRCRPSSLAIACTSMATPALLTL